MPMADHQADHSLGMDCAPVRCREVFLAWQGRQLLRFVLATAAGFGDSSASGFAANLAGVLRCG
jgi:hypothetical protein